MKFVADLHIHSHYSRATSKNLNFEHLYKWAQLKGIHVVGSGDLSHPGWLQEMRDKLEPAEEGLFRLKRDVARAILPEVPPACRGPVRFLLTGEISGIYKKNERVRKIHNVIFAPTLEVVQNIQTALEKIGNIRSDGRPILGLDSRDLLEIILELDPQNYLIPAHIWTPWFSLLGSKSGFDTVEECFGDLSPHIFAVETGLSSDPPMNWRISMLDKYTLVSNSDAHSPQKLGREANLFNTALSYPALFAALKSGNPDAFLGTIEFFPEEGKYHCDGHRKCGIRWTPAATREHGGICPKCGKAVTVGVLHRVESLADRIEGEKPARTHPFRSIIPLPEILSEVHQVGPTSKKVRQHFEMLLAQLGPELAILQDVPLEDISQGGGPLLAEAIRRMRQGEVNIAAGFDGEFGVIKLFNQQERDVFAGQMTFLSGQKKKKREKSRQESASSGKAEGWAQAKLFTASAAAKSGGSQKAATRAENLPDGLNPAQQKAVRCTNPALIIVAGPGTGKTRTLTVRIAHLISKKGAAPENILAITFTNKAATEMAERLEALLPEGVVARLTIKTFHAFGAMILQQAGAHIGLPANFTLCTDDDRQQLLKLACPALSHREINAALEQISAAKNRLLSPDAESHSPGFADTYRRYELALRKNQALDFDDLILHTVRLLAENDDVLAQYRRRFRWVFVDEYQDINFAQYRLLRQLTGAETNLCVIGDPDQAIYGFRGADRRYFLQFQQDFPAAKMLSLNRNYRSTQMILDASGQVISKSSDGGQLAHALRSDIFDPARIEVCSAATDKAEAEYVVHEIEKMVGGTSYFSIDSGRVEDEGPTGRAFADFAVLYRLRAQSPALIEAFDRSGIPYQTIGQKALVEHREIKDILAYLWFLNNPNAILHLGRILNIRQSGFDAGMLDNLQAYAVAHKITLWDALQNYVTHDIFSAAQKKQLGHIVPFLAELERNKLQPVSQLIERIGQHHLLTLQDKAAERVQQFILRATSFGNRLRDFLESTALQKETDMFDPRADRVTLMTLHAAKGLEFPVVFIVGCEENLLPYQRSNKPPDVEEERRLFYVGMTRARQRLILSHAQSRFLFGKNRQYATSRFVNDIEQTLKEMKESSRRKRAKEKPESVQLKLF